MITIYDMTSGTLRKELEDSNNQGDNGSNATDTHWDTTIAPELQLQEIELTNTEQSKAIPSSLLKSDADQFIDQMK